MFPFGKKSIPEDIANQEPLQKAQNEQKQEEKNIKNLMSALKQQHGDGIISEKTYVETFAKNAERLKQIKNAVLGNNSVGAGKEKQEGRGDVQGGNPGENRGEGADTPEENIGIKREKAKTKATKNASDAGKTNNPDAPKEADAGKHKNVKNTPKKNNESGGGSNPKKADETAAETPIPQEKTVGEILKDQGVIRDEQKSGKLKVEQEVDLNQMLISIEKLGVEVGALRDVKFNADERIKEISENIGEIRSLVFQRDSEIKEAQMKIEKMDDALTDIKPGKLAAEMKKREQELLEAGAKIEKLERMNEGFVRQISSMQRILENVKSMENLISVSREIEDKLSRIEELKSGAERDAEKSERMYLEIERRMRDLAQIKESVRKLDALAAELVKSVDEEKIKISGFVNKEDVQKSLEEALTVPGSGELREDKAREKADIESLLKNLQIQYEKGMISKESFEEVSGKNKALIQILDSEIKKFVAKKSPQTIFDWIGNIQDELKELQIKLSFSGQQAPAAEVRQQIPPEQGPPASGFKGREAVCNTSQSHSAAGNNEAEAIRNLISDIESQYRAGTISESTYDETIRKNRRWLAEIEREGAGRQLPRTANKPDNNEMAEKLNSLRKDLADLHNINRK